MASAHEMLSRDVEQTGHLGQLESAPCHLSSVSTVNASFLALDHSLFWFSFLLS